MRVRINRSFCFLFIVTVLVLTSTAAPQQSQLKSVDIKTDLHKIRIVTIAEGLDGPWSTVFLPNGDMLVAERPGRLRLISNGKLQEEPIAGLPEVAYIATAHSGLLDVALHP